VTTKLLKSGPIPPWVVPPALINYLPADAVDRVFSARLAGTGTAEETRAERALDAAVEAILAAAAEEERIAQADASAPAVVRQNISRVFGFPSLDSGPILGAFREQLFTRPVNTASAYIGSLAAIAAPLAANAAAGSVFAAAALAAAARPLASAAVSGSSAAAQALGVIIEPLGAAAAAGGSVAGAPEPNAKTRLFLQRLRLTRAVVPQPAARGHMPPLFVACLLRTQSNVAATMQLALSQNARGPYAV
jgi:hypothetical protein